MTLTAEQKQTAKAEAIEFLEYSIYRIGLTLGLLPDEISSTMQIPVAETDPAYVSYQSLIRQVLILEGLTES